ncbi:MAG TPA: type III polyketide synthase [Lentisphaeria bacterium]|nr:type III polyketide synthase [Lentisphaeria bacterium]
MTTFIPVLLDNFIGLPVTSPAFRVVIVHGGAAKMRVNAHIQAIGTAVPPWRYDQLELATSLATILGVPRSSRILAELARNTAIASRYSVLPDFSPTCQEPLLYGQEAPTTATRNRIYEQLAAPLAARAASATLASAKISACEVTHLITVSCTGFSAPGIDVGLIHSLKLAPHVQRFHLGFMGCFAGLPALHLASQIVIAQPGAVVLVVCCELCSLHFQPTNERNNLLSASIFADGAGAALVSADPTGPFRLGTHGSILIPDSTGAMAWQVGDTGFIMGLSREVPRLISDGLRTRLAAADGPLFTTPEALIWAVHPGGAAILEACATGLSLPTTALANSYRVLRDYGNLSSATILFVLKELLADNRTGPGCALAFGPGLTANWLTFHR